MREAGVDPLSVPFYSRATRIAWAKSRIAELKSNPCRIDGTDGVVEQIARLEAAIAAEKGERNVSPSVRFPKGKPKKSGFSFAMDEMRAEKGTEDAELPKARVEANIAEWHPDIQSAYHVAADVLRRSGDYETVVELRDRLHVVHVRMAEQTNCITTLEAERDRLRGELDEAKEAQRIVSRQYEHRIAELELENAAAAERVDNAERAMGHLASKTLCDLLESDWKGTPR